MLFEYSFSKMTKVGKAHLARQRKMFLTITFLYSTGSGTHLIGLKGVPTVETSERIGNGNRNEWTELHRGVMSLIFGKLNFND